MSTTSVMVDTSGIEELKKFIRNNNLDFPSGGRNTNLVTLIGYALYIGADIEECKTAIPEGELEEDVAKEIERLYTYCKSRNYGDWWKIPTNSSLYKL